MKKLLLIPGSIRKGSYNKKICEYIKNSYESKELEIEILTLNNIPVFNEDLEIGLPIEIKSLINKFQHSNYILISTPEYNNMMPGVLKNMFEWLSRDYSINSIKDKPLAIIGATPGGFGTVRAQNQLLLLGLLLKMRVNPDLRLPISNIDKIFINNILSDENTINKIDRIIKELLSE